MPSSHLSPRALAMLAVLAVVWGANWSLFPLAVREMSVWTFRAVSMPVGGAALLLLARLRGLPLRLPRMYWGTVVLATLCYLVVWNVASTYAAILIPSGQAAVLGFTMPLWAALIGWLFLGTGLSRRMLLALALGAAGVVLLMVPGLRAYADAPAGMALGLLAAVGWAAGMLILKRGKVQVHVLVLTGWQLLLGSVPMVLMALLLGDHRWFLPSATSLAVIAWITLVPMCIGNVCWFAIAQMLPPHVAGLGTVMVPIVAMLTGAWWLQEPLGFLHLASMAASAIALVLALGERTQ